MGRAVVWLWLWLGGCGASKDDSATERETPDLPTATSGPGTGLPSTGPGTGAVPGSATADTSRVTGPGTRPRTDTARLSTTDTSTSPGDTDDTSTTGSPSDTGPWDTSVVVDTSAETDTATTTDTAVATVVEVVVLPHDDMVLLKHLLVRTDRPGPVWIQCTSPAATLEDHRLVGAEHTTEHRLLLDGLLPNHAYTCTASAGGVDTLPFDVVTDPMPHVPPVLTATLAAGQDPIGAYTIFTHWSDDTRQHVYIVDDRGRIRWYWREAGSLGGGGAIQAGVFAPHQLFLGGSRDLHPTYRHTDLRLLFRAPDATSGLMYHHDADRNDRDQVVGLSESRNEAAGVEWEGFRLDIFQATSGALLWSWDSQEGVDAGWLPRSFGRDDPWHANAVKWVEDEQGEGLLVSLAANDRLVRLEPYTGRMLWQLGRGLDFDLVDETGAPLPDHQWFYFQHDPDYDGTSVVLHDNGKGRPNGRLYSRGVRLRLDKVAGTATLDWVYREPDWYEPIYGGMQALDNGHVLIGMAHSPSAGVDPTRRGALVEVDPTTNEVIHRLELERFDDNLYRGERVAGCDVFHNAAYCPELAR